MKLVIIKTSSLGDILHAFPVVSYLSQKFPDSQIDWVVEKKFSSLVQAHPKINKVITVDTKSPLLPQIKPFRNAQSDYDIAFDLQGNIKSGIILALTKAKKKVGFGFKSVPEWPNIFFTNTRFNPPAKQNIRDDLLFLVQSTFSDFSRGDERVILNLSDEEKVILDKLLPATTTKRILVAPGAAWKNKCAPLDHFLKQIEQKERPLFYFSWGSPLEKQEAERLQKAFGQSIVLPKLTLSQLQNFMARVDLVVAMDSLPLHLAGTTGTATFAFFGPSSAQKYNPKGDQHRYFQGICPYGLTFEKRCDRLRTCKTGACLKSTLDVVLY